MKPPVITHLKDFLEAKVEEYNRPTFIDDDPILIPHTYKKKQDIEIAGFWTAMLAWGKRKTIINKCKELFCMMDNAPHDFMMNHQAHDLKALLNFKHRTFNATDTLYFVHFFKTYYEQYHTLENAFTIGLVEEHPSIEVGLINFHRLFFSLEASPERTRKHVTTPERNAACKRISMFLRWMVRQDNQGVDFGLWKTIKPQQLVCPCDIHVGRVGRKLGLIQRKQTDWKTALELTQNLKILSPLDPVKYDFALFGLGVVEQF
ncbi:MAG: TIGR02757 family protein [Cytophagales bacterium]|nr:TIGR02757 family protein [Cytophagales bacterium]